MLFYIALFFLFMLGSIPTGVVIATLWYDTDPRKEGSGNIGMTNVWRLLGWKPAMLTLIGDLGKGALGICVMKSICDDPISLCLAGSTLVLGHCYSAYLQFSGGKGVATAAGVLLALHRPLFLAVCAIWLTARFTSGKSSLSALVSAAALLPLCYWLAPAHLWTAAILVAIVAWRHGDNIQRLRQGRE